jgi:hypothetical protein
MALGDQIGELSGRITGTRVITPSAGQTRIEVPFQGSGTVLGQDVTNIATYSQTLRPGASSTAKGTRSISPAMARALTGGALASVGPQTPSLRGISAFVVPPRPSRRRLAASTRLPLSSNTMWTRRATSATRCGSGDSQSR